MSNVHAFNAYTKMTTAVVDGRIQWTYHRAGHSVSIEQIGSDANGNPRYMVAGVPATNYERAKQIADDALPVAAS